jgi:hypothetical protein
VTAQIQCCFVVSHLPTMIRITITFRSPRTLSPCPVCPGTASTVPGCPWAGFSRSRICARGINPGIAEAASAHSLVALLDSWSGARSKGRIVEDRSGVIVGFIHARRRSMVCLVLVVDSGVTKRCLRDRLRTPSSMKGMTMMVGRICQIEKGLTRRMIQVSCNPAGRKTCISG